MATFNINYTNKTIEVSESFASKARVYNSNAYNELMKVQNAHPNYSVSIVKTKTKKTSVKGITVEFMRNYIKNHDDTNFLEEFNKLKNGGESFFKLKARFVEHYPIFKSCKTKADWILAV